MASKINVRIYLKDEDGNESYVDKTFARYSDIIVYMDTKPKLECTGAYILSVE